ncbi:MAG: DUF4091 domain-containing protein [Lentisphaerae bacterium]|nr:DUF4091 domain-containing protein [Lentisphaerota bacterium]MBT5608980.1 DUF4091 domain-containing protein [Lentisphaerota bacterium]MBT7061506.1 DUF4091 domain-containing protein [Lentisphaerota bacterium]MBT7844800.1 DUF4091 domain-containing protein [Lentisphaerota bacterium]
MNSTELEGRGLAWHLLRTGCLAAFFALGVAGGSADALERIWFDGSRDASAATLGTLLSDNAGFWGDCVRTGVTYVYEVEPNSPADRLKGEKGTFGRRLLDGKTAGNWHVPVGLHGKPVVAVLDFGRSCMFTEVDVVCTRTPQVVIEVATRAARDAPWNQCSGGVLSDAPDRALHRVHLPARPEGRYLRVSVQAEGRTYLDEVLVWGDTERRPRDTVGVPPELVTANAARERAAVIPTVPLLDGVPGDTEPLTAVPFSLLGPGRAPDSRTQAYFAFCPGGLYILFECREPNMAKRYTHRPNGPGTWRDDAVEIFLNPVTGHLKQYYHFGLTSAGNVLHDHGRVIDPTASGKPPAIKVAIGKSAVGWTAEALVPLTTLVGEDRVVQEWRLCLARARRTAQDDRVAASLSSWPPIDGKWFHHPGLFATVSPKRPDGKAVLCSIPGMGTTAFSPDRFRRWHEQLRALKRWPAVWSLARTDTQHVDGPVLPNADDVNPETELLMAGNETECAAFFLTNTGSDVEQKYDVSLSPFQRVDGGPASEISAAVRVAGAIWTRRHGVVLRPLFASGNMLCPDLMEQYLTNGRSIQDFPSVRLPPGGSAMIWVSVATGGAAPGAYQATLAYSGGPAVVINLTVVDVELLPPPVWLMSWSRTTTMFPFEYADRQSREVAYKQGLGVTVWHDLPEPGTVAALARANGHTYHRVMGLPREYVHKGYCDLMKATDLTDEDRQKIANHLRGLIAKAETLGLSYDDWCCELWDEPNSRNAELHGVFAQLLKEVAPNVRIYCNPCFWGAGGHPPDATIGSLIEPWYNASVDISVPSRSLCNETTFPLLNTRFWNAPRRVNALYQHPCPGRGLSWEAFRRGFNGWGFYSYYAPRGDPWNDFDDMRFDYVVVYPGPRGPVPTIESEQMREGWEDYCLLTLLKQRKLDTVLASILDEYAQGERPFSALRRRALTAALPGNDP